MNESLVSTQRANDLFGRYNALHSRVLGQGQVFKLDPIVDLDPQTPDVYIYGIREVLNRAIPHALTRVDIDVTNACGNDCPHCFTQQLRKLYPGEIPTKTLIKVLNNLKTLGCDCVRFTGGGDPLEHSDFIKLIEHSGRNFKTVIQTNGDGLRKKGCIETVAEYAHRIRISVDAGDNATRRAIHRAEDPNCTYDQLIENMQRLKQSADTNPNRKSRLLIGASFTYSKLNYRLVEKFFLDMMRVGIDWVRVSPALSRGKNLNTTEIEESVTKQVNRVKTGNYPLSITHIPNRVSQNPPIEMPEGCWMAKLRGYILAHSYLSLCCQVRSFEVPFAYVGALGDNTTPIDNLLFSKEGRKKIKEVQERAPAGCKFCLDLRPNVLFDHIANVLMEDPEAIFGEAFVIVGENTRIIDRNTDGILQVELKPEDLQSFNGYQQVKLVQT